VQAQRHVLHGGDDDVVFVQADQTRFGLDVANPINLSVQVASREEADRIPCGNGCWGAVGSHVESW
jgi:hypothetical protein